MSKSEKLYAQMKNNPLDWRIGDLDTVAKYFGLSGSRPGKGWSHVTYRAANGNKVTVPDHRPVKRVYVIKFIMLIEELKRHD